MSQRTYAIDALARHQVYIQRFSTGEVKRLLPFIRKMRTDIMSTMAFTEAQAVRLITLEQELAIIINSAMREMGETLILDMQDFGEYEAGFTARFLNEMATTSSATAQLSRIIAAINTTPMKLISGKKTVELTIEQAVAQFAGSMNTTLSNSIRTGIAEGKTTAVMAKEVGRIIKTRTTQQAEALIRTAANHVGTVARNEVYQANADILTGEEFVAVLDNKTSLPCASNDGKTFDLGEGAMPALHFNCRSIRVPVVDPQYLQADLKGDRPAKGDEGLERISAQSTYGGWLRKQPASFQDTALGAERAKLFRNGGLSIDKFTNDRSIAYSIDELRGLEPQAFERAGL